MRRPRVLFEVSLNYLVNLRVQVAMINLKLVKLNTMKNYMLTQEKLKSNYKRAPLL